MKKLVWLGIGLVVAGIIVTIFLGTSQQNSTVNEADHIHEVTGETGNIPEKVIGNPDTAKVVLYEYADYGCSHCAEWNKTLNNLIKEYPDELAIVFRSYDLGYKNGKTVALAATSAQLAGYWKEYKDLLFANQAEWFYADNEELEEFLIDYFVEASDGKGNVEEFLASMSSDMVEKRVEFENGMGKKVKLRGTPTFRIGGKTMNPVDLLEAIHAKIDES